MKPTVPTVDFGLFCANRFLFWAVFSGGAVGLFVLTSRMMSSFAFKFFKEALILNDVSKSPIASLVTSSFSFFVINIFPAFLFCYSIEFQQGKKSTKKIKRILNKLNFALP